MQELGYFDMVGARKTILLIEDEPLIRMSTSAILEDGGYRVFEAANADEAQTLLAQYPEIAIVVTDVQMPGTMDGLQLASFICHHHSHISVLITSGRVDASDARRHGAADYIAKPYSAAMIEAALEQLKVRPSE